MLCPEVWNFPPPKIITYNKKCLTLDSVAQTVKMNVFYKSLLITIPDELQIPKNIEETITDDSDYYRLTNCPLTELIEPTFVKNFVKNGSLYCLSSDRNCMTQNCVCITSNGILTLHVLDYVFQTLGFEGVKRAHNYYEVTIDLINLKHYEKVKQGLKMLETFDLYLLWEPSSEEICPSSIAKYFSDQNITVTQHSLELTAKSPFVNEIPSVKDAEIDEMAEWVGLLALDANLSPSESYISTYSSPESELALKSTRISLLIIKGFLSTNKIVELCKEMTKYVSSREMENYWASISIQSHENCLWQWSPSSTKMFQANDSSCSIFFTNNELMIYSVGQLKYS